MTTSVTNVRRKLFHHPSIQTLCEKVGWLISARLFPQNFHKFFPPSSITAPTSSQATGRLQRPVPISVPFRPLQIIIFNMSLVLEEPTIFSLQTHKANLCESSSKKAKAEVGAAQTSQKVPTTLTRTGCQDNVQKSTFFFFSCPLHQSLCPLSLSKWNQSAGISVKYIKQSSSRLYQKINGSRHWTAAIFPHMLQCFVIHIGP